MLIFFEIDCFYGLWIWIYEYGFFIDLLSFCCFKFVFRIFFGGGEKVLELVNFDIYVIIFGCEWIYDILIMLNILSNMVDKLECLKKFSVF